MNSLYITIVNYDEVFFSFPCHYRYSELRKKIELFMLMYTNTSLFSFSTHRFDYLSIGNKLILFSLFLYLTH